MWKLHYENGDEILKKCGGFLVLLTHLDVELESHNGIQAVPSSWKA